MRKVLIASVASVVLALTMAVPAGASVLGTSPARGGGSYGGGGHSGGDGSHAGRGGDGRDRDGRFDHDGHDHDRYGHDSYYDYGPYYDGPYYDGPGACPDDGYYDANGTYWYWDPATDSYVAC
jgi:hypothetical protein